jgi:hypothetical protein
MFFQKYWTGLANQMQEFLSLVQAVCGVSEWPATHNLLRTKNSY